jgi:predicted dehydrogenase
MANMQESGLLRRRFIAAAAAGAATLSFSGGKARAAPRKIKIGQTGTGHAHARSVFACLKEVTDDYEIVGVVENDPRRREALKGSYQGIPLISEEQLFNTAGLEAVVVETEVRDLLPTAARCVQAGVHIHLDKPPGE